SSAIARKAETGVSRSAVTDFTTGTRLASRARRVNSLYSGCSMRVFRSEPMEKGSFRQRASIIGDESVACGGQSEGRAFSDQVSAGTPAPSNTGVQPF